MLLEYDVTNFKSFKDEAYMDMRPAKNRILNRFPSNYRELPSGQKVLKASVVVGENAGGKSNFVQSIQFLKRLMTRNDLPIKSDLSFVHASNLVRIGSRVNLTESDTRQTFQAYIALDKVTYRYSLVIDALGLVDEELDYAHGAGRSFTPLFHASRNPDASIKPIEPGAVEHRMAVSYSFAYSSDKDPDISRFVKAYKKGNKSVSTLHLVLLATLGNKHCQNVMRWFTDDLFIVTEPTPEFMSDALDRTHLNDIMGSRDYLAIVKLVDPSISDFEVDSERPFTESRIERTSGSGKVYSRLAKDDSTGVQRFLLWAVCIYLAVHENKVVIADEIDSCINPTLSDRAIAFIQGSEHEGQFVFTTHNIFNLTLRTFMKEQINIVTKDSETLESALYSLADYPDIRYDVNKELYEFYLQGSLGGIADA